MSRPLDVVIYGATGFTGRQCARYLDRRGGDLRWAIAGRSPEKLSDLRDTLDGAPSILVADSGDAPSVQAMASQTRVLISTAGPFALYGGPVVAACARRGTDYVDITGEAPFVRRSIDAHHAEAAAGGTRIVPCCGFDSVPSDMGAWLIAEHLRAAGRSCRLVRAGFQISNAGLNGGTAASALNLLEDPEGAASLADPFYLNPPGAEGFAGQWTRDPGGPWFDPTLGRWTAPFFMAPINTRIVRRSAALYAALGRGYGPRFEYRERLITGGASPRLSAAATGLGLWAAQRLGRLAPLRALAGRLAPAPGEGPAERAMDQAITRCRYAGLDDGGREVLGELSFRGDAGNRFTVTALCEAALTLALSPREALPGGADFGGVLTPAAGLGAPYLERLRAAGVRLELSPPGRSPGAGRGTGPSSA